MFKKISHIVLSALLLVSTIGVAISKHYCGGSLISTSLFTEAEPCCETGDCCQDETNFYQVNEDYSLVSVSEIPFIAELDLIGFVLLLDPVNERFVDVAQDFIVTESPPPPPIQITLSKKQVYLL